MSRMKNNGGQLQAMLENCVCGIQYGDTFENIPLYMWFSNFFKVLVIHHKTWQLYISYKLRKSHSMKVVMYSAEFRTWLTALMKNKIIKKMLITCSMTHDS